MNRRRSGRSMRDDARRYRFLRDQTLRIEDETTPSVFNTDKDSKPMGFPLDGQGLDRAIDLAIETHLPDQQTDARK